MDLCPDCRFQVEVPALKADGWETLLADRLIAQCPNCRIKFPAPARRAGTIRPCPGCNYPVQVPTMIPQGEKSRLTLLVAIAIITLLFYTFFTISTNRNSTFNTVGRSIPAAY
jgi:hypothetical protein